MIIGWIFPESTTCCVLFNRRGTCFISCSSFCYFFYKNSCRNAIHLNCLRTYRRTFDSKYTMFRIIQFIS